MVREEKNSGLRNTLYRTGVGRCSCEGHSVHLHMRNTAIQPFTMDIGCVDVCVGGGEPGGS